MGEEGDDAADFFGLAHAVHGDVFDEFVEHEGGDGGDHVGFDEAGGDGVDGEADAFVEFAGESEGEGGFAGEGFGESEESGF